MSGSANTHARKAPSDSKRWVYCTNAIAFERMHKLGCHGLHDEDAEPLTQDDLAELAALLERFETTLKEVQETGYCPDDETKWNAEGTDAHDWAEKVLLEEITIDDVPEDFRDAVRIYTDDCFQLIADHPEAEPLIESQVPLFYDLDSTGTMDFAIVSNDFVKGRDYKHGAGVYVEEVGNEQVAIYLRSLMEELQSDGLYTFEPGTMVEIGIAQPRHHAGDPIRIWELSYADLCTFCEKIEKASDTIDNKPEECVFAPGTDTCRWCKCKAFCEARHESFFVDTEVDAESAAAFLEALDDPDTCNTDGKLKKRSKATPEPLDRIARTFTGTRAVSIDVLVAFYRNAPGFRALLNDIEEHLTDLRNQGYDVTGTKMVMGRPGNWKYKDEDEAERMLENQGFTVDQRRKTVVATPSEAAKLLGKKIRTDLKKNPELSPRLARKWHDNLTRSDGKPVLALEEDSRPSIEDTANQFEDESHPEDIDDL